MFSEQQVRKLLGRVAAGDVPVDDAVNALRTLPFEDIDVATLDHHRQLRNGFGEVVFCHGKTPDQVARIFARLATSSPRLLGTRATPEQFAVAQAQVTDLKYHEVARAIWFDGEADRPRLPGTMIVTAGTSDTPVAEEVALTLHLMGHAPKRLTDVGIAGLHRVLHHLKTLQTANVIVAVAGMEGALPSIVSGLVRAPVIAVPTSVGYGASFGGVAALLAMLNSCAAGVATVNIDNGFGAAYLAAIINTKIEDRQQT